MPTIVFIGHVSGRTDEYGCGALNPIVNGQAETIWETGGSADQEYVDITWSDTEISWYSTSFSNAQMNYKNCTYRWIAVG